MSERDTKKQKKRRARQGDPPAEMARRVGRGRAATRESVDAFHAAALAAGGRDNGAPGLRAYSPGYYAAFVLDPDGYNVEAVCHLEA